MLVLYSAVMLAVRLVLYLVVMLVIPKVYYLADELGRKHRNEEKKRMKVRLMQFKRLQLKSIELWPGYK